MCDKQCVYATSILMATLKRNLSRPHSLEITEERYVTLAVSTQGPCIFRCIGHLSAVPSSPPSLSTSGYLTTFLSFFCCWLVAKSYLTLLQPHRLQPSRLLCPWDSPGKNTGVGFQGHTRDSSSRGCSQPRNQTRIWRIGRKILYH